MKNGKLTKQDIAEGLSRLKWRWVDEQLKRVLPKHIYQQAHSADRHLALKWMQEKGYRVEDGEEGMVFLKRGAETLATAKLEFEISSPDHLLQVAKVAKIMQPGDI